jgi:hypothetical protein
MANDSRIFQILAVQSLLGSSERLLSERAIDTLRLYYTSKFRPSSESALFFLLQETLMPLLVDKIKWEAVDMQTLFYTMDVLLNLVPSEQMLIIWLCVLRAIDKGTVVQEGENLSGTGLLTEFLNEVLQRVCFLTATTINVISLCR